MILDREGIDAGIDANKEIKAPDKTGHLQKQHVASAIVALRPLAQHSGIFGRGTINDK
jgi:hypothetical protein